MTVLLIQTEGAFLIPGCPPQGRYPCPYPRRVNTKGGTARARDRTKDCSAPAASGPPPPVAEAKGQRPRALEPLAPMSAPPAHGGPSGRSALTVRRARPCPAPASTRRCCRRRLLPQAVSTETSLPLPHAMHAARSEWLKRLSLCEVEPMASLRSSTHQDALPPGPRRLWVPRVSSLPEKR